MLGACIEQGHLWQRPGNWLDMLDLMGVQVVRWEKEGTVKAGDYSVSMGKETKIISWEQGFLYITEYYQQLRE